MTASIDLNRLLAGTGQLSQRNQTIADVRRGGWLLELERAQLSSDGSKTSNEGTDTGRDRPMAQDAQQATISARRPVPAAASVPEIAQHVSPTPPQTMHASNGVTNPGPPLTQSVSLPHAAMFGAADAPTARMPIATAPSLAARLPRLEVKTLTTDPDSLRQPQDMHHSEAANTTAGSSEQYPFRQIHLYRHDGQVQAWIRDPHLGEQRVQVVVGALRQELKDAGLELIGISINGKKIAGLLQQNQHRTIQRGESAA